jgi:hypothetical protein
MLRGVVVASVFLGSWAWGAWDYSQDSQAIRDASLEVISSIEGFADDEDYFEEILDAAHTAAFQQSREVEVVGPSAAERYLYERLGADEKQEFEVNRRLHIYFDILLSGMERRASEDGRNQVARQVGQFKAELMAS